MTTEELNQLKHGDLLVWTWVDRSQLVTFVCPMPYRGWPLNQPTVGGSPE